MNVNFDKFKSALSLLDVIKSFGVSLKRQGSRYVGLCPFHNEKTPSFYVNGNYFKCFGCQKGGDVITFVQEQLGCNFIDAVGYLSSNWSLENPIVNEACDNSNDIIKIITWYYRNQLRNNDNAIKYLRDERKFTGQDAKTFGIGYSPDFYGLVNYIAERDENGEMIRWCVDNGWLNRRGSNVYDPMAGRIVFPITTMTGNVIGVSGRTVIKDKKPKWLHTNGINNVLFGADKLDSRPIFICEGPFDYIRLKSNGFNAVGVGGTSIKEAIIKMLINRGNQLVFLMDGDNAGRDSIVRIIKLVVKFITAQNNDIYFILLNNQDPDEFLKEGGDLNALYEQQKKYWFNVANSSLFLGNDDGTPQSKAKRQSELRQLISSISDKDLRWSFSRSLPNYSKKVNNTENATLLYIKSIVNQHPELQEMVAGITLPEGEFPLIPCSEEAARSEITAFNESRQKNLLHCISNSTNIGS